MNVIQRKFREGQKLAGLGFAVLAMFIGSVARYIWHYIAGIVFWGSYAPEGQPAWVYSLIVNGSAWLGSFLFCSFVMAFLLSASPRVLTVSRNQ